METKQILDLIDQGVTPKLVAEKVPWLDLSAEQRENLFGEAEKRIKGTSANSILAAMYYLTREQPWDLLRVVSLVVRSKSSPYERKIFTLGEMRKKLDQLRDSFSNTSPQNANMLTRYKNSEADYYALNGMVLFDAKKPDEAVQHMSAAVSKYEALGAFEKAEILKNKIAKITEVREKNSTLVPVQALEDERSTLQEEISRLIGEQKKLKQEIERLQSQVKTAAMRLNKLETELKDITVRRDQVAVEERRLAESCTTLQLQVQELERQLASAETGLRFLLALPRLTMSPLWVEVVRMAIAQGNYDDLTMQALERLTVSFPDEAAPLLAEMAARAEDHQVAESIQSLQGGFALIARASSKDNVSLGMKASMLLEGWEQILNLQRGNSHA